MGLYLCIFDEDEEIEGMEVGSYADYNAFREHVVKELEAGAAGSKFPTLILHSDCEGEWSVEECKRLKLELLEISDQLRKRPAVGFSSPWQTTVAKSIGLTPQSAFESFIDVDGEFVLDRLVKLTNVAIGRAKPILFQ